MAEEFYALKDILSIARIHPFYSRFCKYPPNQEAILHARSCQEGHVNTDLATLPLSFKDELYSTIQRLCADECPENGYRHSSYASITGGGSGKSLPMLFLTDGEENLQQRLAHGRMMKACGMVEPSDWALNVHPGGSLYRALDLSASTMEYAGGNVLCAGHVMPHEKAVAACIQYRINFLSGDTAQVLNFAHHVDSLPASSRSQFKIKKIMYSAEMMTRAKRNYLVSVFGPLSFFSVLGAAETGAWAVANLQWSTSETDDDDHSIDFVYDARHMKIEVLSLSTPLSAPKPGTSEPPPDPQELLPEGTAGHLILTSLQRLRNPLVRYVSGDVGSLHPLPPLAASHFQKTAPERLPHLRVLRLYGRDHRFSFKWLGEYYEFEKFNEVMQTPEWGILQWQVILDHGTEWEGSDSCEVRLLRRRRGRGGEGAEEKTDEEALLSDDELLEKLHDTFFLVDHTKPLWRCKFVSDMKEFERSETSEKVVKFLDRRGRNA